MRRANHSKAASRISFTAINEPEAADYMSKRCGDTTVEVDLRSQSSQTSASSRTRSKQLARRPLIMPHEAAHANRQTNRLHGRQSAAAIRPLFSPTDACMYQMASFYRKQGFGTSMTIERCVHDLREDRHAHARRPRAGSGSAALAARVEPSPKGLAHALGAVIARKMVPGDLRAGTRSSPPPSRTQRAPASPRRAAGAAGAL
ncbi:hypothetical protein ACVII1_000260 [Bradyrhizobium elkanii]|jgi:type IV secretory system conjugative DNA transfer VirD4/TraG family protein|uniref:Uncharacterized protein n=1 Tax=Bradyrhizobium elkanii TaxID=29448 RepID=A0ABV4EQD4_BRAEL|nr:hypothetical protein [Bradyrhizobium elkanii]MCP1975705.1 hypothetical protein [Bradyrhizobium elkanii]MCP1984883.1 hypothetical protein [Bradyrhizobium elkanii]MCS3890763.1 hypothetical protein [Bradyrhizobium elkanii]MCS4113053.1 hypothetical protein [Bradyrhizobium elkanii]